MVTNANILTKFNQEVLQMLEHKGKVYARVSDILKPFVDFGNISEEVLNRKAALGTRVHDAIHKEIKGELPVLPLAEQGYLQSFDKWARALMPTFVETEMRCYCDKIMLTGCIDALAKLEGEKEAVLIDWKTSVAESGVTWPMQAHLYYYLLKESGKSIAPRFLFVKLDRWGNLPKVFQYKFDTNLLARCLQGVKDFWEKENVDINREVNA